MQLEKLTAVSRNQSGTADAAVMLDVARNPTVLLGIG
jgi:hypothetical protein